MCVVVATIPRSGKPFVLACALGVVGDLEQQSGGPWANLPSFRHDGTTLQEMRRGLPDDPGTLGTATGACSRQYMQKYTVLLHRTLHMLHSRPPGRVLRCPGRRVECRPLIERGAGRSSRQSQFFLQWGYAVLPKLLHLDWDFVEDPPRNSPIPKSLHLEISC